MGKRARVRHVDQFLAGFSVGDAISNEALLIQEHLRTQGYSSEIYCEQFAESDAAYVRPYRAYHRRRSSVLVYHHSYHTEILRRLRTYPASRILIFHNVTPPGYVDPYNRRMAASLARAREELRDLHDAFHRVFAVSHFNAGLLRRLGFEDVDVMPVPLRPAPKPDGPVPSHLRYLTDGAANILFVGRIVPNKRHQDLIKAFYLFQKLRPDSRMVLVGPFHPGARGYAAELHNTVRELELTERVVFTGMVPPEDLPYYYREAMLFLSMSEHEGFFVPLLESMFYGLPVLAHASSVVPETLGAAGIQFLEKDFPRVALMMERLARDPQLRASVAAAQLRRWTEFSAADALSILDGALATLAENSP